MRWYIKPKDYFADKNEFEFVKFICELFNAQEVRGIDERS
jgi:hypothetical protein